MTAHTPDALASALPAGISYVGGPRSEHLSTREIAEFQAERLAESGYVLVHTAPDEALLKRLAAVVDDQLEGDTYVDRHGGSGIAFPEYFGERVAGAVLAALADTPAQARHTAADATGGAA